MEGLHTTRPVASGAYPQWHPAGAPSSGSGFTLLPLRLLRAAHDDTVRRRVRSSLVAAHGAARA
jgi:hypothetical protein